MNKKRTTSYRPWQMATAMAALVGIIVVSVSVTLNHEKLISALLETETSTEPASSDINYPDIDKAISEEFGATLSQLGIKTASTEKGVQNDYLINVTLFDRTFQYGSVYPDHRPMTFEVTASGEARVIFHETDSLVPRETLLHLAKEVARTTIKATQRFVAGRQKVFM